MKKSKIISFVGVLTVLSTPFSLLHADTLSRRVEQLEEDQKILERKLELDAESQKEAGKITAGSSGFTFKSGDGNYVLKLRGYVQSDARFFFGDEDNLLGNTFLARRVRPIFDGTLFKIFDFRIMPDFGGGSTVLQDGYVEAKFFPWLKLRAGKFREPFGIERLQSATNLVFIERGLPNNLVPNRDLGVQLSGDLLDGVISYAVGAFNGVADGGSGDLDSSDGKDVAGRIFVKPFKLSSIEALKNLGLGFAATYGHQSGSPSSTGLSSIRSGGQNSFFSFRSDASTAAATVVADGSRYRYSPQLYYSWGPFGLLGEYVSSTQNVNLGGVQEKLTNRAWQVAASFVLTGEKAGYDGVTPKKPFDIKKGHWGAVELAGRYNELRVDEDAFPVFANPDRAARRATAFAGGVNWHLNKNVKLAANYEQTLFKGGSATGNRPTEKVLLSRLQLNF